MENLEEVLQALDEFQKIRPTVIPQELEDYLCWVAKTGDPVYQWSLIKTLFREKLTRVMTDFYESCPTLELAPCPNVEHFNYDTMKSTLLERLESFANAPFTVQRICELLTAPRKEYNRVDKFMRAIEKNILVVSTREPGPIARRGDTGDGMVNGSVEEDTATVTQQQLPPPSPSPSPLPTPSPSPSPSLSQASQITQPVQPTSQDVEMEWEQDCTSTVTISVHNIENEQPLLHSGVIPNVDSPLTKNNVFTADETTQEKLEQVATTRTDIPTSNYISATSDFSTISNLTTQTQSHESVSTAVPAVVPIVQSLPIVETTTDESTIGNADIAEAIMNEDTNSQPNLDLESEEIEEPKWATTATTANISTTTATTTTTTATTTTTMSTAATSVTTATTTVTTIATSTTSAATTTVTVVATVIPLTTDTTRKLQAAFQAKRFESGDNKCLDKTNEKTSVPSMMVSAKEELEHSMKSEETTSAKLDSECMDSNETPHDESRLTENLLQTDIETSRPDVLVNNPESVTEDKLSDKLEVEGTSILEDMDEENLCSKSDESAKTAVIVESQTVEKDNAIVSDECIAVIVTCGGVLNKTEKSETHSNDVISSKECFMRDQSMSQEPESMEVADKILEAIPGIVSSDGDVNEQKVQEPEWADNFKIMDIANNKTALVESIVSDTIRVIEKLKETTSVIEKLDLLAPIVEMAKNSDDVSCSNDDKLTDIQDDSLVNAQGNKATACIDVKGDQSSVIESVVHRREHASMELMEVDDEGSLSTFQQDESVEEKTMKELPES